MGRSPRRAIIAGPMLQAPAALKKRLRASLRPDARDLVIAVDGGVETCRRLGLKPRCAVGDWDSYAGAVSELPPTVERVSLSRAKDRSDLHYAAALAVSAGARELVFVGITGGRPDHQLGSLYEVAALASVSGVRSVTILGEAADYHFLGSSVRSWSAKLVRGTLVSVFAIGGQVRGLTLTGFAYPLSNATLGATSQGLSNVATALGGCRATLKSGSLALILPLGL